MKRIAIILFCGVGLFMIRCSPQLYLPASADVDLQQQLLSGRTLYVNHCGSCHNLYLPSLFNAVQWQSNLNEMQQRASITDADKQLIYQYLEWHDPH